MATRVKENLMRVKLNDLTGLIQRRSPEVEASRVHQKKASGLKIARANELRVATAISKFGHLRIAEIGHAVWPKGSCNEQMAQRTCRRLLTAGYVLARRNAVGETSYVLTNAGANALELRGIVARNTLELSSVAGATFIHRSIGSRFLISEMGRGYEVAGEYEISTGRVPFSIAELAKRLKKQPDGLVWKSNAEGELQFSWVEVENAAKPKTELLRLLSVASHVGRCVDVQHKASLVRLTIVYDAALNHDRRLLLAANVLWGDLPQSKRIQLESRVDLVAASIAQPLRWLGSSTQTLSQFRAKIENR